MYLFLTYLLGFLLLLYEEFSDSVHKLCSIFRLVNVCMHKMRQFRNGWLRLRI
jgi:hypothetical protein